MWSMFRMASSFNQDISGWCVELIENEPADFSTGSPLIEAHKPEWGTCGTTSINETEHPLFFTLAQNYPNPFNPSTRIAFDLPRQEHVRLEVYDLLGRRVALLVDEARPAGQHAVDFDAGSLGNGVYLYRITAGGFNQTRKMMLMK